MGAHSSINKHSWLFWLYIENRTHRPFVHFWYRGQIVHTIIIDQLPTDPSRMQQIRIAKIRALRNIAIRKNK